MSHIEWRQELFVKSIMSNYITPSILGFLYWPSCVDSYMDIKYDVCSADIQGDFTLDEKHTIIIIQCHTCFYTNQNISWRISHTCFFYTNQNISWRISHTCFYTNQNISWRISHTCFLYKPEHIVTYLPYMFFIQVRTCRDVSPIHVFFYKLDGISRVVYTRNAKF